MSCVLWDYGDKSLEVLSYKKYYLVHIGIHASSFLKNWFNIVPLLFSINNTSAICLAHSVPFSRYIRYTGDKNGEKYIDVISPQENKT